MAQQGQPIRPPQQQMTQQQAIAWMTSEAAKHNMTVEQFQQMLRAQAERQHAEQQKMAQQQQQAQQGQQVPIQPGPPNPQALAVAKWLRGQELKPRTCILNGQRKDMFKGM
jgi:translocation protein SEC62